MGALEGGWGVSFSSGMAAVTAIADLVWVESPTNPLLEVGDLAAICALAHQAGARCVVDNTGATPILVRPFESGADPVVHSATKFLSGYSDALAGIALTTEPSSATRCRGSAAGTGRPAGRWPTGSEPTSTSPRSATQGSPPWSPSRCTATHEPPTCSPNRSCSGCTPEDLWADLDQALVGAHRRERT